MELLTYRPDLTFIESRVAHCHVSLLTVLGTDSVFRKMKSRARFSWYRVLARILLKLSSLGLGFSNKGLGVSASLGFYHLPPLKRAKHYIAFCYIARLSLSKMSNVIG